MVGTDPVSHIVSPDDGVTLKAERIGADGTLSAAGLWWRGLASAGLIWLSFPPCQLWPLAWIAPLFWIQVIRVPKFRSSHPYRVLYAVGLLHWLLLLQWVRLPHWSAWIGWLMLSGYLAIYLPLFIALARILAHRTRVPLWLTAPLVWTVLEWARGWMFTGFSLLLWGHSQFRVPELIQIADWGGAYAVSFLLVWVAAAVEHAWHEKRPLARFVPLLVAIAAVGGSWFYGRHQQTRYAAAGPHDTVRVALIQGSIDTTFEWEPGRTERTLRQYQDLTDQAIQQFGMVDLIIWPETIYPYPLLSADPDTPPPANVPIDGDLQDYMRRYNHARLMELTAKHATHWLIGTSWEHWRADGTAGRFNSAVLVDPDGGLVMRYDKMHPVMFGEYVPLGDQFPILYKLTPMPSGLSAGRQAQAARIKGLTMATNICFENTVPHLVQRQVKALDQAGTPPQVILTVTNDGWFWGSSLLDLHLICAIFRSVEHRCTGLVAANTGLSAQIDPAGQVLVLGMRRTPAPLLAEVPLREPHFTFYRRYGDAAVVCLVILLALLLARGAFRSG